MNTVLFFFLAILVCVCLVSLIILMSTQISYLLGFSLKKYTEEKNRKDKLTSYCPWQCFVDDGIVLLKAGALSRTFLFRCPDLEATSNENISIVSHNFNEALKHLGSGWTVQFEVQRTRTIEYPDSQFTKLTAFIIDQRRMENYQSFGTHFFSTYFVTFTYELPNAITEKAKNFFFSSKGSNPDALNMHQLHQEIENFKLITEKTVQILSNSVSIHSLNSQECATYLHSTVSLNWNDVQLPDNFVFLDHILCDQDLKTALTLQLGENYIPVMGIDAFPIHTYPAMFDSLNMALCEYRWTTRFICLDTDDAKAEIQKYIKRHHGGQKSIGQLVGEMALKYESTRINQSAIAQENDSQTAMTRLVSGDIGFGYYTSNIMVWDTEYKIAKEKLKYMSSIVTGCGFTAREETFNAFQAFLGMQPGNPYANVRRPLLSTGNTSHVLPISTIWEGVSSNLQTKAICNLDTPHVVCSTAYGTPLFLNLNVGDVFHTAIFGPSGAGKSTLLRILEAQWLKYTHSKVIIIDKDRSARGLTIAMGGYYVEPGMDEISFQPLADLETNEELLWASEFIECLLTESNVEITPKMRVAINNTLIAMSQVNKNNRTLSYFRALINSEYHDEKTGDNIIHIALESYSSTGQFGFIFDNGETNLPLTNNWTMIEMGSLMKLSSKVIVPALMFLFRYLENSFDGSLTLLNIDEAWLALQHEYFRNKMQEWLKTLRKKNVACVFATQEVHDAANSEIAQTIAQQCLTKIYLADPNATTKMLKESYVKFGLSDAEILTLSRATMKQDYFYKSPMGVRLFQLDLDPFQLALLNTDHELLDELEEKYGRNSGRELAYDILCAKGFEELANKYINMNEETLV